MWMYMIDFRELVKAGVHFGHQKSRWSPKMAPYIWGFKNNVHLIDVSKTASQLEKAAHFLQKLAEDDKTILWVGTKRPAQEAIFATACSLKMPYVNNRWIGGTLSNFPQVKKSITKLMHFEDVIARAQNASHYTKKELNTFQKIVDRLEKNVGGIRNLKMPVGALVVVDVHKERSAIREASTMGIPVVALVDTNSDPSLVNYVIPANDDAPRSITLILNYLRDAVAKGIEVAQKKQKEARVKLLEEKKEAQVAKKVLAAKVAKEDLPKVLDQKRVDSDKATTSKAQKDSGVKKESSDAQKRSSKTSTAPKKTIVVKKKVSIPKAKPKVPSKAKAAVSKKK
jgi:small subunit ribosomal protein S2